MFDSFEGLPKPKKWCITWKTGAVMPYHRGQYAGTLAEVQANIRRFGAIHVCDFVQGFRTTLPGRTESERFVLIFEDVDLPQSVRSVRHGAWKKLIPGGVFFCHEARDQEVVKMFFNQDWWVTNLNEPPPGFVGSGIGMVSGPGVNWCCLGYAIRAAAPRAV